MQRSEITKKIRRGGDSLRDITDSLNNAGYRATRKNGIAGHQRETDPLQGEKYLMKTVSNVK